MFVPNAADLVQITAFRDEGALFVVSDSSGKDSQAMKAVVRSIVPDAQILIVHAMLDGVEWEGTLEHIHANSGACPILVAKAATGFWDMVDRRGMFPSPKNRQCTSDLKRTPIEREVRRYLKAHPEYRGRVVMCMGMRAEESTGRSRLATLKRSASNSKAGREWWDWLPIHAMTTPQVFETITAAGQVPHWAYAAGMTRLSCCFCIMASAADLTTAAKLNPGLYQRYAAAEREMGFTLSMSRKTLPEITGVPLLTPENEL